MKTNSETNRALKDERSGASLDSQHSPPQPQSTAEVDNCKEELNQRPGKETTSELRLSCFAGLVWVASWLGTKAPLVIAAAHLASSFRFITLGIALLAFKKQRPIVLVFALSTSAFLGANQSWNSSFELSETSHSFTPQQLQTKGSGSTESAHSQSTASKTNSALQQTASGKIVLSEVELKLATDPQSTLHGLRFEAYLDGERISVNAYSSGVGELRPRLMGEKVIVDILLNPNAKLNTWQRSRHVVASASIRQFHRYELGGPLSRLANSYRKTIEAGAVGMSFDERALYTGLLYGDDRAQSPLVADDFTAAGLGHLLAVSGQNVAFVLALARPILLRVSSRWRLQCVLVLLVVFATITRFEASVMRACVMAFIACAAALLYMPLPSKRLLPIAIITMISIDPLINSQVAFQLSVAACVGIIVAAKPLTGVLPGPMMIREAVAVTLAAQFGVSPFLIYYFGQIPLASIPANLLGSAAAGPVMMLGTTVGWLAGFLPESIAAVIQLPSRLLLKWISTVAHHAGKAPLGNLTSMHLLAIWVAIAVGITAFRKGFLSPKLATANQSGEGLGRDTSESSQLESFAAKVRLRKAIAAGILCASFLHPMFFPQQQFEQSFEIYGAAVWVSPTAKIAFIEPHVNTEKLLAEMRVRKIETLDALATKRANHQMRSVLKALLGRVNVEQIYAPRQIFGLGEQSVKAEILIYCDEHNLVFLTPKPNNSLVWRAEGNANSLCR